MGRAQKLKKQRKQEKLASEQRISQQRKITLTTIVTIILVVIGGFWLNSWYQNNKNSQTASQVVMHTNFGDIKLALYSDKAPKTVENFVGLAQSGYYNDTLFHRIISDFMIQGGDPLSKDDDPTNDGTGGEDMWGGKFEDEINPWSLGLEEEVISSLQASGYVYRSDLESIKMKPGVIAMANSGPNTNGSQFFIVTTKDQPHLDGRHTVFGEVIEGMDVVLAMSQVETDETDRPKEVVKIDSIEVLEAPVTNTETDLSEPMGVTPVEVDNTLGVEIENISFE